MNILQSLDRGLVVLEHISTRPHGALVQELADEINVHRAVMYRILATLEQRHLVVKGTDGSYTLGSGILAISQGYLDQLRSSSQLILQNLADQTRMTAFLTINEKNDAVAVAVAAPRGANIGVSYRVGARHDVTRGAHGMALLALHPPHADDSDAVRTARARGFAISHGELQKGASALAMALRPESPHEIQASIGLICLGDIEEDTLQAVLPVLNKSCEKTSALL